MRHRVTGKKLSRTRSHRKALFKNLLSALIIHGEIKTTESKAKSTQRLFDKLVTKSKKNTLHSRRTVAAFLNDRKVVNKLVDEITPEFKNRTSGFTRIIRLGKRKGDDAMEAKLELVTKPAPKQEKSKEKKAKKKKNEKNQSHQKK